MLGFVLWLLTPTGMSLFHLFVFAGMVLFLSGLNWKQAVVFYRDTSEKINITSV